MAYEIPADMTIRLLTCWFLVALDRETCRCFRVADVGDQGPDGFDVTFASGLVVRVEVKEVRRGG